MSPRRRSLLSALGVLSCAALARGADLPPDPAAVASEPGEAKGVVAPPQAGPAEPQARRPSVSRWYGGETLAVDGASIALAIAALSLADEAEGVGSTLGSLSLVGYGFGAPVLHLIHEHPGRALGSLALRGALPLTFGYIGAKAEDCEEGEFFCGVGGAVLGGLAGIVTAMVVDAAVLSYEEVPAKTSSLPSIGVFSDGRRTMVTAGGYF